VNKYVQDDKDEAAEPKIQAINKFTNKFRKRKT
jgi:hypothetical protein